MPSSSIVPASGSTSRTIHRASVVLPLPGPSGEAEDLAVAQREETSSTARAVLHMRAADALATVRRSANALRGPPAFSSGAEWSQPALPPGRPPRGQPRRMGGLDKPFMAGPTGSSIIGTVLAIGLRERQRGPKTQPGRHRSAPAATPADTFWRLERPADSSSRDRLEQRRACRGAGRRCRSRRSARLDDAAAVHHRDAIADLRDHAEVVGDEHTAIPRSGPAAPAEPGSAPGWSRRVPSSARPRAAAVAATRSRARSSPAGACRR